MEARLFAGSSRSPTTKGLSPSHAAGRYAPAPPPSLLRAIKGRWLLSKID
jgi:hypothetical protein